MRASGWTVLTLAAAVLGLQARAQALWIVFDPENFAQNVAQVEQQIQTIQRLRQQIEYYQRMVENWEFSDVDTTLRRMRRMLFELERARQQMGDVAQRFPTDWGARPDPDIVLTQQEAWVQTRRQRAEEVLEVHGLLQASMAETAAQTEVYVAKSNSAPGQLAAQQASNEILALMISQLQDMQALETSALRSEIEEEARLNAMRAFAQQYQRRTLQMLETPPTSNHPPVVTYRTE